MVTINLQFCGCFCWIDFGLDKYMHGYAKESYLYTVNRNVFSGDQLRAWFYPKLLLCWCFTALRHFSGNFGCGQLIYPHCSWANLLGSLPVLSEHSFTSNWLLESVEGRMAIEIILWQSLRKNVAWSEDPIHDHPHTRWMRIRPSYCPRLYTKWDSMHKAMPPA